jgi:dihydrofolate reductase
MHNTRSFEIIAAVDHQTCGMGYKNKLAWHCREDMDFFKQVTLGHIVIMGYRTWKSLAPRRHLPQRINIVVSNTSLEKEQKKEVDLHGVNLAFGAFF